MRMNAKQIYICLGLATVLVLAVEPASAAILNGPPSGDGFMNGLANFFDRYRSVAWMLALICAITAAILWFAVKERGLAIACICGCLFLAFGPYIIGFLKDLT